MRSLVFILYLLMVCLAQASSSFAQPAQSILLDPRDSPSRLLYHNGEEAPFVANGLFNAILIIGWHPDPAGNSNTYQISGIDGYHDLKTTLFFLENFYNEDTPKGAALPNLILCPNNWGAVAGLLAKAKELSKSKQFSVFEGGGWPFQHAQLHKEPTAHQELIRKAFAKTKPQG